MFRNEGRKEEGVGLVSGTGLVKWSRIVVHAHVDQISGWQLWEMHARKIVNAIHLAKRTKGIDAGVHFGDVFFKTVPSLPAEEPSRSRRAGRPLSPLPKTAAIARALFNTRPEDYATRHRDTFMSRGLT